MGMDEDRDNDRDNDVKHRTCSPLLHPCPVRRAQADGAQEPFEPRNQIQRDLVNIQPFVRAVNPLLLSQNILFPILPHVRALRFSQPDGQVDNLLPDRCPLGLPSIRDPFPANANIQ